jgi:hypothetical protein
MGDVSNFRRAGAIDAQRRRTSRELEETKEVSSQWKPKPTSTPAQRIRWGAITLRNSLELMILVFFQNLGKCRWFPVTW